MKTTNTTTAISAFHRSIPCQFHKWPQEDFFTIPAELMATYTFENGEFKQSHICVLTGEKDDPTAMELDVDDIITIFGHQFSGNDIYKIFC